MLITRGMGEIPYPAGSDVREGVEYGDGLEGTLIWPVEQMFSVNITEDALSVDVED